MINREIEKGKAIIQLAQMMMILSGFLFAIGGIAYTNSIYIPSSSLSMITQQSLRLIELNKSNLTINEIEIIKGTIEAQREYLSMVKSQLELMGTFLVMGLTFIIFSVLIWVAGYWKIKKEDEKNIQIVAAILKKDRIK